MQVHFSAQQYKQMSYDTLKDKFIPFMIGLGVTVIALSAIIARFPTAVVARYVHDAESKVNSIHISWKAPSISNLNINKALGITPTQAPLAAKTTGVPTSAPTSQITSIPTPTVVENGQISAITSEQVTIKGDTYVVQEGEGLSDIANKAYGDGNMWTVIAEANNLASPDLLEVGMKLKIPRKK